MARSLRIEYPGAVYHVKARKIRSATTMPLAWLAERLNMGTRGYLAWLLRQAAKQRFNAPDAQTALVI